MHRRSLFVLASLMFTAGLFIAGCGSDGGSGSQSGCETDGDCPGEASCLMGQCSTEGGADADAKTEDLQVNVDGEESVADTSEGGETDAKECVLHDDCGDGEKCFNGTCKEKVTCEKNDDCKDGFECVDNECFEKVCRGPSDCEGDKICDGGECVSPPDGKSCFVATSNGTIIHEQRIPLKAFARDAQGNGVPANFKWRSSNPEVAKVDSEGPAAVGGKAQGRAEITAALENGTACDGKTVLRNPGDVQSGNSRIIVTDLATGDPVEATVALESEGTDRTFETNSAGIANFEKPDGEYDITVYSEDHNYVTVLGLTASDLRIPLSRKSGSGPISGFTGEFDTANIHTSGSVTLGMAGASFPGGLLNLSPQALVGAPFRRSVQIPGRGEQEIPLPGGVVTYGEVMGFSANIKETYYAKSSGGARLAWGLAGKVPGAKLVQIFQGGGGLTTLLPLFNRFDHAVEPMQLQSKPRVTDQQDIDGDGDTSEKLPDYNGFQKLSLAPDVEQDLVTAIEITNFPKMSSGEKANLAVLVGGTVLDAAGFLPLGISATEDENEDGAPDTRKLSLAPPHGSSAGGRFATAALAFNQGEDGGSPTNPFSANNELSASIWTGQRLEPSTNLGTFPDATEGEVDRGSRKVTIEKADAGPVYRVKAVGQKRTWSVWTVGPSGSNGTFQHELKVPKPQGGRTDVFESGDIVVEAIAASASVDDIANATGVQLDTVGLITTGFNRTRLATEEPSSSTTTTP